MVIACSVVFNRLDKDLMDEDGTAAAAMDAISAMIDLHSELMASPSGVDFPCPVVLPSDFFQTWVSNTQVAWTRECSKGFDFLTRAPRRRQ
jgi:hypothetical protein